MRRGKFGARHYQPCFVAAGDTAAQRGRTQRSLAAARPAADSSAPLLNMSDEEMEEYGGGGAEEELDDIDEVRDLPSRR